MRFSLRLGYLVLAVTLIGTARADANIWDWLEELNGPGPSRSRGNFMLNIKCLGRVSREDRAELNLGLFQLPKSSDADATCIFVDQRWLHAEEDERFYPVSVSITEAGTSAWLHPAVELGAGVGVLKFSSRNPNSNEEFGGTRMTISFPRFVFRPLLALPFPRFRDDARWGFFQVFFKETIVVGDLSQDDFASKPGTAFARRHQRVESMGFIIDATPAVDALIRVAGGR
jgi:hypothetical protein